MGCEVYEREVYGCEVCRCEVCRCEVGGVGACGVCGCVPDPPPTPPPPEWLKQTRISLSLFDVQGLGFLREMDLENYILELIPTLPQLSSLEESFYSFYVCTAVRRFFFFLDPLRTGE